VLGSVDEVIRIFLCGTEVERDTVVECDEEVDIDTVLNFYTFVKFDTVGRG